MFLLRKKLNRYRFVCCVTHRYPTNETAMNRLYLCEKEKRKTKRALWTWWTRRRRTERASALLRSPWRANSVIFFLFFFFPRRYNPRDWSQLLAQHSLTPTFSSCTPYALICLRPLFLWPNPSSTSVCPYLLQFARPTRRSLPSQHVQTFCQISILLVFPGTTKLPLIHSFLTLSSTTHPCTLSLTSPYSYWRHSILFLLLL